VHAAAWPGLETELAGITAAARSGDVGVLTTVTRAISRIRKAKSDAKVKQRTEVLTATITATEDRLGELKAGLDDLRAAGNVSELSLEAGEAVTNEDDEIIDLRLTDIQLAATE
jgi:valyl-tRNA synthetase